MGWVNTADIIDRMEDVLEQYLGAEVTFMDTQSNANGDETITTPTIPAVAIQGFRDDKRAQPITVTIIEESGMTQKVDILQDNEGAAAGANLPRFLQIHHLRIDIRLTENSATGGIHGAYRMACRVKEAIKSVMATYPELSVPATPLASLVQHTELVGESAPTEPTAGENVQRSLSYAVRTEDVRTA